MDGEIVDVLRALNLIPLLATVVVLAKPAWRSFTKAIQPKDVLWFIFWFDAFNRAWFVIRALHFSDQPYAPGEAELAAVCYVFAIFVQALVIRAYLWGSQ